MMHFSNAFQAWNPQMAKINIGYIQSAKKSKKKEQKETKNQSFVRYVQQCIPLPFTIDGVQAS